MCLVECYVDHRDLHVLTHSFPTRRSSDLAHTPDGLDAAIKALRPHAKGRLIVVVGAGGDRDTGKRPEMGKVAVDLADHVIVTDDNPRSEDPADISRAIMMAAPGANEIGGLREAIATANHYAGCHCHVPVGGTRTGTGRLPSTPQFAT